MFATRIKVYFPVQTMLSFTGSSIQGWWSRDKKRKLLFLLRETMKTGNLLNFEKMHSIMGGGTWETKAASLRPGESHDCPLPER